MLNANEGSITKTVTAISFINISLRIESFSFEPDEVNTIRIPNNPNKIDEYIKTFVAIFCIVLL